MLPLRQLTPVVKTHAYVLTGVAKNSVQTYALEEHVDTLVIIKSELVKAHRTSSSVAASHTLVTGIAYASLPLIGKRTLVSGKGRTLRSTQASGVVEGETVED